jgi:hypothetical protein
MIRKIGILILILVGSLIFTPLTATAQTPAPSGNEPCRSCHENRYFLYDSGKWYCMCAKQAECAKCHAGTTGSWDPEIAHQGLIANPLQDNLQACQSCHPQDYQERVEKFAAVTGLHQEMTPTPTEPVALLLNGSAPVSGLLESTASQMVAYLAIVLLGISLLAGGLYILTCCRGESLHI